MLSFVYKIFRLLLRIILVFVGILVVLNLIATKSSYQETFTKGQIPTNLPDGHYQGKVHTLSDIQTPWLGKSFNAKSQTGFNVFTSTGHTILTYLTPFYKNFKPGDNQHTTAYNFKTSVTKGVKDPNLEVITIDYNTPENPWLIRIIRDEIVAVGNDEYLGKIHLKIYQSYYLTLGYFALSPVKP